jgi:hypothetical protein
MRVEAFGQHDDRAKVDVVSPPFTEDVALELDVLDVSRVGRRVDRRIFRLSVMPIS